MPGFCIYKSSSSVLPFFSIPDKLTAKRAYGSWDKASCTDIFLGLALRTGNEEYSSFLVKVCKRPVVAAETMVPSRAFLLAVPSIVIIGGLQRWWMDAIIIH
jgi:hypothetical protein